MPIRDYHHPTVKQIDDSGASQNATASHHVHMNSTTNHNLLSQLEVTKTCNDGTKANTKSSNAMEVDGWDDDDFSLDEEVPSEPSVRDPTFVPLVSDSRPPVASNTHLPIEPRLEPATASRVYETTIAISAPRLDPNAEIGNAPPSHRVAKSIHSAPEPAFHYVTTDDIIPTRQRWINKRTLAS